MRWINCVKNYSAIYWSRFCNWRSPYGHGKYVPELMTYPAAMRLKNKLEHIWQVECGLPFAKARVVCETREGGRDLYCVRSNVTFDKLGYPLVDQREHLDVHGWTWEE